MNQPVRTSDDDLSPQSESWAQISIRNSISGVAALVFAGGLLLVWTQTPAVVASAVTVVALGAAAVLAAQLRPVEPRELSPSEQAVVEALKADPEVNARLIRVSALEGAVRLVGRQETVQAVRAASRAAASAPGVEVVDNELEVMPSV